MSIKLNELQEDWKQDAEINQLDLGRSSSEVPLLHAKWLERLSQSKLLLRMATAKYLRLRRDKARYYNGEMTRDELQERGWQQYQGVKPLKSAMNEILQTDEDLIIQEDKVAYLETNVQFLESVMKSINSRTWDIKNSIDFAKLQAGN
jgi:hypothetical protein